MWVFLFVCCSQDTKTYTSAFGLTEIFPRTGNLTLVSKYMFYQIFIIWESTAWGTFQDYVFVLDSAVIYPLHQSVPNDLEIRTEECLFEDGAPLILMANLYSNSNSDSHCKPNGYIVICRTFHTAQS